MKILKKSLAMFLTVIMLAMNFSGIVQASEPTLAIAAHYIPNMKVPYGEKLLLYFSASWPVYASDRYDKERLTINLYEGNTTNKSAKITTFHKDNISHNHGAITEVVDTRAWCMEPGTYTMEAYMEFYYGKTWVKDPEGYTNKVVFYVIKDNCNGKHQYVSEKIYKEAHCQYVGAELFKCKKCGGQKAVILPKIPHIYGEGDVIVEATCTKEGKIDYNCTRCIVHHKIEKIPAAHKWNSGTILKYPTVSNAGKRDCTCTVCRTDAIVEIPPIFSDVYNDWYTSYVQYVYDETLMTGIKGTTKFDPLGNITKAQVAQVLYNIEGQPAVPDKSVFSELKDVYSSEWYANAVAWAYNSGVVTGDLNTKKFNPNANVTREQLALMMYRYAQYNGYKVDQSASLSGLKNQENVSNWSRASVEWAVGVGLISGIEKNGVKDLAPQGTASRAQMAAILQRFLLAYPKQPLAANESVAKLVQYIKENGTDVSVNGEVCKRITGVYESSKYEYDSQIVYMEEDNTLYFIWSLLEYFYVSFRYDVETGTALTPLYYEDYTAGTVFAGTPTNFDIANYRCDTVLPFEIIEKEGTTESNAQIISDANTLVPAAVLCWEFLLEEQPQMTLDQIGFDEFNDSLNSAQVVEGTQAVEAVQAIIEVE